MRECNIKNSEKLFLLRVCLPSIYEEIGDVGIEAVKQGWAKEQDYRFINELVHNYVATALNEMLSFEGSMQEKMSLIRTFNFFLYEYIEREKPKTQEEVNASIREYYTNLEEAVKLGG